MITNIYNKFMIIFMLIHFLLISVYFLNDFISRQMAWVWLLWLLSQTWITLHIWTPKCERLASTEKLFVIPMYNSLLIDQSMGLNRRCQDQTDVKTEVSNQQNPYREAANLLKSLGVMRFLSGVSGSMQL